MEESLIQFWQRTWAVWKSSTITNHLIAPLNYDFESFIDKDKNVNNTYFSDILMNFNLLSNEFLVETSESKPSDIWMILTNLRIWIKNINTGEFEVFEVNKIDEIEFHEFGHSHTLLITAVLKFIDGSEHSIDTKGEIHPSIVYDLLEFNNKSSDWTNYKLGQNSSEYIDFIKQFGYDIVNMPKFQTQSMEEIVKEYEPVKKEENSTSEIITCPNCYKEQAKTSKCSCGYYFDKNLYNLEKGNSSAPYVISDLKDNEQNEFITKLKKIEDWFIFTNDNKGVTKLYNRENFKENIKNELINGNLNANGKLEGHYKDAEGKWTKEKTIVKDFVSQIKELRMLYNPVWNHALIGLKWGAIIGVGLKILDTAGTFYSVDPLLAFLFVGAFAVMLIPKIGTFGMIASIVLINMLTEVNVYVAGITAALTGLLLGSLPGMFMGGFIGLLRKNSIPKAHDASDEPIKIILASTILPLIGAVGIIYAFAIYITPWLLNLAEKYN